VKLTDAFMEAVLNDTHYDLKDPRTGEKWEGGVVDPRHEDEPLPEKCPSLPARLVFNRLVRSAWKSGEPGIGFIDRINRENPIASVGKIRNSNPCGEFWLTPYSSCNLGSINLSKFYIPSDAVHWERSINWEELAETVRLAVRFLDHVISINEYPVPEIGDLARDTRPVGLGVMGFADLLLQLRIRYGGQESLRVAGKLMLFINYMAWLSSVELAGELGSFPKSRPNREFFDKKLSSWIRTSKWLLVESF